MIPGLPMRRILGAFPATVAAALAAAPAWAHHFMDNALPGTLVEGLLSGLGHPLIGVDHAAFIVATGCFLALVKGGMWGVAALIAGSLFGAALHLNGIGIVGGEIGVALSVIVAGGLLIGRWRIEVAWLTGGLALAGALQTDAGWIREHTRLTELARHWHANSRRGSDLLRGDSLASGERWLGMMPRSAPPPMPLLTEYLLVSRQTHDAEDRERQAQVRAALTFQSHFLMTTARQLVADGDQTTAALLAVETLSSPRGADAAELRELGAFLREALEKNPERAVIGNPNNARNASALSPNGELFAAVRQSGDIGIWDGQTGSFIRSLDAADLKCSCLALEPAARRLACGTDDGRLIVFDIAMGSRNAVGDDLGPIEGLSIETSGRYIAMLGRDKLVVFAIDSGAAKELMLDRSRNGGRRWVARFSPDGSTIATSNREAITRLWDTASGRQLRLLEGHTGEVTAISYSPDGKLIATASADASCNVYLARTAAVWDAGVMLVRFRDHGMPLARLRGHVGSLFDVCFDATGRHVATASADRMVRIWDARSGKETVLLSGHKDAVRTVCFDRSGNNLLSTGDDLAARVWSLGTGGTRVIFGSHTAAITDASYGRTDNILTRSDDGTIRIWRAPGPGRSTTEIGLGTADIVTLVREARRSLPRTLTLDQRAKYFLSHQPPRWYITGADGDGEPDSASWHPKWPYEGAEWRTWLEATDRGEGPSMPVGG